MEAVVEVQENKQRKVQVGFEILRIFTGALFSEICARRGRFRLLIWVVRWAKNPLFSHNCTLYCSSMSSKFGGLSNWNTYVFGGLFPKLPERLFLLLTA